MSNLMSVIVGFFVSTVLLTTAVPLVDSTRAEPAIEKTVGTPPWQWVKGGGGYAMDYGHDIGVDASRNSYVVGKFHGSAVFGSITLTSHGGWDIFVAKLGTNGDWQWVVSAGGMFQDEGLGIAVDDAGNSYITGIFYDVAYFGNITLPSVGGLDVFVAKLDTNGNWQWAIRTGGWVGEAGYGIAVDDDGFLYVTGHFMYRADIGNTTLYSNGSADVFVAKLDQNRNWLWAVSAGGPSEDYVHDIAVDKRGTVSIAGDFMQSAVFGTTTLVNQGGTDVFVAQLDTNGRWLWAKSAGGSLGETALDVAFDSSGNTIITGPFIGSATFGATMLSSIGGMNVFVAKLDASGDWMWSVSGGAGSSDSSWGVAVDTQGTVYISGVFEGSAEFGTTTLTAQGMKDVFVACLDAGGGWRWAVGAGGADCEECYALAVDSNHQIYTTGYFDGSATFGTTTITTQGDFDVFIAKLSLNAVDFALAGGLGVRAVIMNNGVEDACDIPWLIRVDGGMLGLIKKVAEGNVDVIPAGESFTVKTGIFFGFGTLSITARVGAVEKTATGTQLVVLSMVNDG
jgi:hypothetical protein